MFNCGSTGGKDFVLRSGLIYASYHAEYFVLVTNVIDEPIVLIDTYDSQSMHSSIMPSIVLPYIPHMNRYKYISFVSTIDVIVSHN